MPHCCQEKVLQNPEPDHHNEKSETEYPTTAQLHSPMVVTFARLRIAIGNVDANHVHTGHLGVHGGQTHQLPAASLVKNTSPQLRSYSGLTKLL